MSNAERKENLPAIARTVETTFSDLARRHGIADFTFAREFEFAMQILKQNDYLSTVACGNPDSLKEALISVAAIGLSLSPINKQAYLVPRKDRVCLDISYQGLVDLATSRGAILWAKAEIVYEKDIFEFQGINIAPIHKMKNVFGDRGEIVGGYCTAKMPTGDLLVDHMSKKEMLSIRDRSEGYKAYKAGKIKSTPWSTDEAEMCKKTLIRRGYKSWPKTVALDAMSKAMHVTADLDLEEDVTPPGDTSNAEREVDFHKIRQYLDALDRPESAFIEHLSRSTNRSIKKLEDLTTLEIDQQLIYLKALTNAQAAKFEKLKEKDTANEKPG